MTEIELDLKKSIQEQANEYFDRAKKAKKKLVGLERAITDQQKKLLAHVQKKTEEKKEIIKKRKKEWFEKFHWFYSSDGLLVIGGRDAQSNESIVKKYMDEKDLYFHADVFGAPHCIIKTVEKNSAPEKTLQEAAIFAAAFSKAWQQKQLTATVYSVLPEQVSKKAPAGESLGQGAFMIYGERNWFKNTALEVGIGVHKTEDEYQIVSGPLSAVKKNSEFSVQLVPGSKDKNSMAKHLKKLFEAKLGTTIDLDEVLKMLPTGESEIKA